MQKLAGGTPSANLLTGLGIDEVFSRTDSLGTRSFVTDALGSTVALTDGTSAIKTSYAYDPYCNITASGEVSANSAQYTPHRPAAKRCQCVRSTPSPRLDYSLYGR